MTKLLHIDSSVMGENSVSRQLTQRIAAHWQATHPGTKVEYLDLVKEAPTHLAPESLGFYLQPGVLGATEVERRENAVSEALVRQFLSADVIVIGAPLYNFSIPSQLKAWIDRISQRGRTFAYGAKGPMGLAGGKTVIVASTRGGVYSTSEAARAMEHQESYLQILFGFLGVTDVRFVRAEGLATGDVKKAEAIAAAELAILDLRAIAEEAALA